MAKRSRLRFFVYLIVGLIIVAGGVFLMGPRTEVSTRIHFDPAAIGEDVETYLADEEARVDDIRDGLQKRVVWAFPQSRAKTPLAIVYIHGFSASSGEVQPLADIAAERLGANLYYARLSGHGRTGDAMAEATVEDWVNDLAEALAIGRRLGEQVIVMGTSTGGTLATWAAAQPRLMDSVAGIINISPNYGVQAFGAGLLTMPWSKQIAELVQGKRRSFEPKNELHARYWTHEYPTSAVLPMAELVKLANNAEIHNIQVPALFVYSSKDSVVRPELTAEVIARWGAATEVALIENSDDENNHVIAGDALSPSTTGEIADIVVKWVEALP